jgi:uncharacterized protein (DUF362 family)
MGIGINKFLVKPNLFTNITSEKDTTTDPKLILSIAEVLKAQGATPILGECPAMASYTRRARDECAGDSTMSRLNRFFRGIFICVR